MLFTSKRVIKKLPIKLDFINKITKSKYFFYGIIILSVIRLINFYRENNTLCLGIFILFILLFVNKKNLNIKTNLGKKREMALGLLFCISITTLLCHKKRLIEGNTGTMSATTVPPMGQSMSPPMGQSMSPQMGQSMSPQMGQSMGPPMGQSMGGYQIQNNNLYEEETKCEENFQKENKEMEELETSISICDMDIEKLEVKERIVIGGKKEFIKNKIKNLYELKTQLEHKKKLLDGQIKKERILEKKAYLISPPELITGGNRPIPVEEYENPIVKEKMKKYLESTTSPNEISKMKHNEKIPESAFKEKRKIKPIGESFIGPSKY